MKPKLGEFKRQVCAFTVYVPKWMHDRLLANKDVNGQSLSFFAKVAIKEKLEREAKR